MKKKMLTLAFMVAAAFAGCEAQDTVESPATLHLVNNSQHDVYRLYLGRCEEHLWGPDQLGTDIVPPGHEYMLTEIPPGCYHIMAESEDPFIYWESDVGYEFGAARTFTWTVH